MVATCGFGACCRVPVDLDPVLLTVSPGEEAEGVPRAGVEAEGVEVEHELGPRTGRVVHADPVLRPAGGAVGNPAAPEFQTCSIHSAGPGVVSGTKPCAGSLG